MTNGNRTEGRVILLEFNELCPSLLEKWIEGGQLPNFKRFRDASQVFVTEADELNAPYLEPWIQWYSMHTGLPFKEHGVFHLADGPEAGHKDLFQLAVENHKSVINWSSMNAARVAASGCAFLPDPWNIQQEAFPVELTPFHRYLAKRIHEYTQQAGPTLAESFAFASFLASHGLRIRSVVQILGQLASERFNRLATWKRATLLDRILSDVFCFYYRRLRPDLATFFINSTAHYQHAYWRYMEPERFGGQPSKEEQREYQQAILFGYQQMDRLLEDFFALEEHGATLVLATALSQQPYVKHEATGGQRFYHPRNLEAFLKLLGIEWVELNPVMAHQYNCRFDSDESRDSAKSALEKVTCNGEQVFGFAESLPRSLFFANQIMVEVSAESMLDVIVDGSARRIPYFDVFSIVNETKSAYHHPDGVLWIKSGMHRRHAGKVSILDVMPTTLGWLGFSCDALNAKWAGKDLRQMII